MTPPPRRPVLGGLIRGALRTLPVLLTMLAADCSGSPPQIARIVGDVNVRSHTFRFVSPADTERYGVPNPCTSCHTDETDEWALEELRAWPHVSPWRVAP